MLTIRSWARKEPCQPEEQMSLKSVIPLMSLTGSFGGKLEDRAEKVVSISIQPKGQSGGLGLETEAKNQGSQEQVGKPSSRLARGHVPG